MLSSSSARFSKPTLFLIMVWLVCNVRLLLSFDFYLTIPYIDDASLRNYMQRALNRCEAYHQLRRTFSSVYGDQFRGSSDEEIEPWNECTRLVTNAIIYFNSKVLSELLISFEHQGKEGEVEIVIQASLVAWCNINLKGTYNFKLNNKPPAKEELMRSIDGYIPVLE